MADQVIRTVALGDLGQAPGDGHVLAFRAGGHVAVDKRVGQISRRQGELACQLLGQTALFGLVHGAGVMSDQPAQQIAGVLDVAKMPGTVQLVEPRDREGRRVPDVVQPRRGKQQVRVLAQDRRERARGPGDATGVRPAPRERFLEQVAGDRFSPVGERHDHDVMPRARDAHQHTRTFPGRLAPSESQRSAVPVRNPLGISSQVQRPLPAHGRKLVPPRQLSTGWYGNELLTSAFLPAAIPCRTTGERSSSARKQPPVPDYSAR